LRASHFSLRVAWGSGAPVVPIFAGRTARLPHALITDRIQDTELPQSRREAHQSKACTAFHECQPAWRDQPDAW
jgi:hypothetical protein